MNEKISTGGGIRRKEIQGSQGRIKMHSIFCFQFLNFLFINPLNLLLALFNPFSFFRQMNINSRDSNCAETQADGGCR